MLFNYVFYCFDMISDLKQFRVENICVTFMTDPINIIVDYFGIW